MSAPQYSLSRLEVKEHSPNCHPAHSGVCECVIGLSATSGAYNAYVDGVAKWTGSYISVEDFSAQADSYVNDCIENWGFKASLNSMLVAQVNRPAKADIGSLQSEITIT